MVITGAASGIGRATALKLTALGADLVLFDISDNVHDVVHECRSLDPHIRVQAHLLDVADSEACSDALKRIRPSQGPPIAHVFNCAGINPTPAPLTDTSDKYFDKLFSVNIKGYYNMTKAAIPLMGPGSSFVNVGSICGLHPQRNMAIYCATKYAVTGFSKSMALELGPKGIRVNVVAPGFINTPTNSSIVAGADAMEQTSQRVAMGRMGTPEEIADVVAFLMSSEARYMNGSVVEVNGGTG